MVDANPPEGSSVGPGTAIALRVANGNNVVPVVEGQSEDAARAALERAGFEVRVDEREDNDAQPGTVTDQSPREESRRLGTRVTIVVATGGEPTEEESTPEPTRSPSPSGTPTESPAVVVDAPTEAASSPPAGGPPEED